MGATWRFLSLATALLDRLLVLALVLAVMHDLVRDQGTDGTQFVRSFAEWIQQEPILALAAAAVLLILNLNLVQLSIDSLSHAPDAAFVTSGEDGGKSRVALAAIQRALRATAQQVAEIARPKIRVVRLGRHRIRVHGRYLVRDVRNAGGAAEHLRLVLKKRFAELVRLGPKDQVEFDLDLAGILKSGPVAAEPKRLPPPDVISTDPFRGPVYPVEGEPT